MAMYSVADINHDSTTRIPSSTSQVAPQGKQGASWKVGCRPGYKVGCRPGYKVGCRTGYKVGCRPGYKVGCRTGY